MTTNEENTMSERELAVQAAEAAGSAKITEDHLLYLPFDLAQRPERGGLLDLYADYWWICHPEKGLAFFRRSMRTRHAEPVAQCNRSEEISVKVAEGYDPAIGLVVLQVDRVYVPKRIDYYRGNAEAVYDLRRFERSK